MLVIQLKKIDYNTKVNDIEKKITDHYHDKCITTPEYNKLTAKSFAARLAEANLVTKTDFDNKLINLNKKINISKTKHVIVENKFGKLQTFDSMYYCGKSHFQNDSTENYLVFQPTQRYFKRVSYTNNHILSWKSKGLSDKSLLLHLLIFLTLY